MGEYTVVEIPTIYQLTFAGTAPHFNSALQNGIAKVEGVVPNIVSEMALRPGPIALWGEHKFFRILQKGIAEGRTWYYGDHAYFGRQFYYRFTKNALQIDGTGFDADPVANEKRFAEVSARLKVHKIHSEIAIAETPLINPDGFVMLCPPSEPLSERSGFTQADWIARTTAKIKQHTNRPIVVRLKPKVNRTPAPLLEAMRGAWCAVTYTSNVATELLMAGWPCFTEGPHPANVFGNTDIANIERPAPRPDVATLRQWAGFLCRNQWTFAEIGSGDAWRAVR
jgi:hypothetical protein